MRRTVFASDTHFTARISRRDRVALLEDFLHRYVRKDAASIDGLLMLGDVFDPLMGNWKQLRRERRLVRTLNETGESLNGRLELLPGNHDLEISRPEYGFGQIFPHLTLYEPSIQYVILRAKVGEITTPKIAVKTISSALDRDIYGYSVRLAHGYEADPYFSPNPKKLNFLIRLGGVLDSMIGAEESGGVSDVWESLDREFGSVAERFGPLVVRGTDAKLLLAARDKAEYTVREGVVVRRPSPVHLVIMGHTHRQDLQELYDEVLERRNPLGSIYVNTGTWTRTNRYRGADFTAVYEDGTVENCRWTYDGPRVFARYRGGRLERYRWAGNTQTLDYEKEIPVLPRVPQAA